MKKSPSNQQNESNQNKAKYDKEGHMEYTIGKQFGPPSNIERFVIEDVLGEGAFSRVFKCLDVTKDNMYAIKVVKAITRYEEAAKHEIEILKYMRKRSEDFKKVDHVDYSMYVSVGLYCVYL